MLHREERRVEGEREGVDLRNEWKDDMWQSQLRGFPASKIDGIQNAFEIENSPARFIS